MNLLPLKMYNYMQAVVGGCGGVRTVMGGCGGVGAHVLVKISFCVRAGLLETISEHPSYLAGLLFLLKIPDNYDLQLCPSFLLLQYI